MSEFLKSAQFSDNYRVPNVNIGRGRVSAEFHMPGHIVPTRDDLAGAASTVQQYLPSREMTLWLGGLGTLAAFSVIDWPVAAAIGAGTIIAKRASGGSGSTG